MTPAAGPDPAWRSRYRAGGISGLAIVVPYLIAIVLVSVAPPPLRASGAETLEYIAAHRWLYTVEQVLWLAPGVLAMVVLLALPAAVKHVDKGYAAIADLIGVSSWALTLALPTTGGGAPVLVSLSNRYAAATTTEQCTAYVTAVGGFIAENNTNLVGVLTTVGILLISLVMLKGLSPVDRLPRSGDRVHRHRQRNAPPAARHRVHRLRAAPARLVRCHRLEAVPAGPRGRSNERPTMTIPPACRRAAGPAHARPDHLTAFSTREGTPCIPRRRPPPTPGPRPARSQCPPHSLDCTGPAGSGDHRRHHERGGGMRPETPPRTRSDLSRLRGRAVEVPGRRGEARAVAVAMTVIPAWGPCPCG